MSGIFDMTNLNSSVKSRGVVIFAQNTDTVNYVKIAEQCSRLVEHTLDLPVTVITLEDLRSNFRTGYKGGERWYNLDRYRAYEISPYDETILIDSDYLILDKSLLKILDVVENYGLVSNNQNLQRSMDGSMGALSLPYIWATVVIFKRTIKTKLFFDLVGRIQRNYEYYKKLYNIREYNFRNDYAFAIANHMINGYATRSYIPWSMLTLDNPINNITINNGKLIIREQETANILPVQNIHVIDKDFLQSDNHVKFIDKICQN